MRKTRILIVEDESVIARDIQESLEQLGYEVAGFEVTGEEAIKAVERDKPDLVLMDIVLQGRMDGIEAAGHIHSRFKIPVIYLTAYADEKILERAKTTEPFGYLLKPFENKELHFTIEMAIYKHKAEEELRKVNRALKTLSRCNDSLVHAKDEFGLLKDICRIIVEVGGYPFAWVALARQDAAKAFELATWHGDDRGYIEALRLKCRLQNSDRCPTSSAMRSGTPISLKTGHQEEAGAPWCEEAEGRGFSSTIALPLVAGSKVMGALTIFSPEPDAFDSDEFDHMVDLASNLTYGLVALQHRAHRERAERALHESHERFTTVLDSLDAIVYVADMKTHEILFVNRQVRDIFGNVVGKTCWRTLRPGMDAPCPYCTNEKLLGPDGRPTGTHAWEFKNSFDGKWYQIYDRAIRWVDGRFVRMEIATDITERKKAEQELEGHREHLEDLVAERTIELQMEVIERKRAEEELLKAQKLEAIGILAGGIAHDFNNILASVITNISLAKFSVSPDDKVYRRLLAAEKASFRAQSLTHQLLTFSMGGSPVRKTASIVELLRESTEFALRGSNVGCEMEIGEDLWPVVIDEGQINQVLNNLIINADQAMPEGGVIRISLANVLLGENEVPHLKAGRYVRISVKDAGIGIPRRFLNKIFDPYFTTKKEGSGLGLASSYSIIKKHEGHIAVESEPGKGACFHVYLPASEEPLPEAGLDAKSEVLRGFGRVLIMDDDANIRESLGDALSFFGYEVDFAEDGAKTIELYRKAMDSGRSFNAVVMDLTIPGGMGGAEALKRLLEIDPGLKAIVSSGYSNDPIMSEFDKFGFRGVITKPYKIEELSRMLQKVIEG